MKLNLVADYVVPGTGGKHTLASWEIEQSRNLVGLPDMVNLSIGTTDYRWLRVRPLTLTMCESRRKAKMIEESWRTDYERDGRLWDYSPIDAYLAYKEAEAESEVA